LYCRLIYPINFDSLKKYPVFIYVYGGPHSQMVTNGWLSGGWFLHYMAQKGYIVFTLDNRGTNYRGFEFESCIHRHLGDFEVEDQMCGVDYLKSLKYVDTERLSIDGWSYGGFMTLSMFLRNPGVFNRASCGGPVIDWKYYEVMYGERYMDKPQDNKEGYEKSSLLNYVDSIEGKILIFHGAMDPTVVWQNSLQFIEKSIKDVIDRAVKKACETQELNITVMPDYIIEVPREKTNGDFATNIAMLLPKQAKMPPRKIAEILTSHMDTADTYIEKVETAGPGFINFYLNNKWLINVIPVIEKEAENYGRCNKGQGKKILEILARIEGTQQAEPFLELASRVKARLPWGATVILIVPRDSRELITFSQVLIESGFKVVIITTEGTRYREYLGRSSTSSLLVYQVREEDEISALERKREA